MFSVVGKMDGEPVRGDVEI